MSDIYGSSSNDNLSAPDDGDHLFGLAGEDTLTSANLHQVLIGGSGADRLIGYDDSTTASYQTAVSRVTVNTGNSTANQGDANNDALDDVFVNISRFLGSSFHDTFITSSTSMIFDGGDGIDLLSFTDATQPLTLDLLNAGSQYTKIEIFQGSNYNDTLIGDAANNILIGGIGADTIDGGDGLDTVSYLTSKSAVFVNFVHNVFKDGDAQGDLISNVENIIGSDFNDQLVGNALNNYLQGASGDDTIYGGAGEDTIFGDIEDTGPLDAVANVNQADRIYAGPGNDSVTTNSLDVGSVVYGQDGNDTINVFSGTAWGGSQNDLLIAHGTGAYLIGEYGDDTLTFYAAGKGDGGHGSDLYIIEAENVQIIETSYNSGTDLVKTNLDSYTLPDYVENLIYTGSNSWTATGNASPNIIQGGGQNDVIDGAGGKDTLIGGAGADTLNGGAGYNSAWYLSSPAKVQVSLASGLGKGADAEGDVLVDISSLMGSKYNDFLVGDAIGNVLEGAGGNDTFYAGDGNDTIMGDVLDTTLSGKFNQADLIYAGPGNDVVVSSTLDVGTIVYGQTGLDSITIFSGSAYGGDGDDILIGKNIGASLYGENGNDSLSLYAAGSAAGGNGNDTYFLYAPGSTLVEEINGGIDEVRTDSSSFTLANNIERLIYVGKTTATLTGNAVDNFIQSWVLNDVLNGGDGNDTLDGGVGEDTLDGGAGINTVTYANSSKAVIVDLSKHTGNAGDAYHDVLSNFRDIIGSKLGDTLTGDSQGNLIEGGAGSDLIFAGDGDDTIYTGFRDSNVEPSVGDVVNGGNGNDFLVGAPGASTLNGEEGDDTLHVYGSGSANGGNGNDVLITYGAKSTLRGEDGADTITTYGADATIYGGTGNDVYNFYGLHSYATEPYLNPGNNIFNMHVLSAAFGSSGDDTYVVYANGVVIVEPVNNGTDEVQSALSSFTLGNNFERLIYIGKGSFVGTGNTLDNFIQGGQFHDILKGDAGNDTLLGGAGPDILDGGSGTDAAWYLTSSAAVAINLAAHTVSGGDAQGDFLSAIENVTGSNFADTLIGDSGANLLQGAFGDDTIYGGAGNDTILGGVGDTGSITQPSNSNQADLIYAGAGHDLVTSNALDVGTIIYGQDGNDIITVYAGTAYGGSQNDQLIGKAVGAKLYAGYGDDLLTLYAAGTANGGNDSDKFEIRTTDQVTVEDYGVSGNDTVYLFNIATTADIATFRVGDDLIVTDTNDALDSKADSGVLLPNWYGIASNTIETFIVGNGDPITFAHS